jgi:hypothetical protein
MPAAVAPIGPNEAKMQAGLVVSEVMGGLVCMGFVFSHERGVLEPLLACQIGGLLAVMVFVARARPMRLHRS